MRFYFLTVLVAVNSYVYYAFVDTIQRIITVPSSSTVLFSFGDPDGGTKSELMRTLQEFSRTFDRLMYPNEVDIPGLTFASPVEWAPWMETIWFGNYYEYRSAFFQDVMYSNHKPKREGALLFRDPHQALQMALLYQRYKCFDESSYALSNATFFNVFGTQTLRLGRYKVPQSDQVLLCITDPLTTSDMKRYFNSFNALKWFKSKFMQQKRKRQYVIRVPKVSTEKKETASDQGNAAFNDSLLFFADAVYNIEYGNAAKTLGKMRAELPHTVPIVPYNLSASYIVQDIFADEMLPSAGVNMEEEPLRLLVPGLQVPVRVFNSQYVAESLLQTLLTGYAHNVPCNDPNERGKTNLRAELHIVDGLLSGLICELFQRVCRGNNVEATIVDHSTLQNITACGVLQAVGLPTNYVPPAVSIILAYPNGNRNITGTVGIAARVHAATKQNVSSTAAEVLSVEDWSTVLCDMQSRNTVNIVPARLVK